MSDWETTLSDVHRMREAHKERSMMYQGHARQEMAEFFDLPPTALDDVDYDKVWREVDQPFKEKANAWWDEAHPVPTKKTMGEIWKEYKLGPGAAAFQAARDSLIRDYPSVAKAARVRAHRHRVYLGMCLAHAKVPDADVTYIPEEEAKAAYDAFVKRQPLWDSHGKLDGQIEKEYEKTL